MTAKWMLVKTSCRRVVTNIDTAVALRLYES